MFEIRIFTDNNCSILGIKNAALGLNILQAAINGKNLDPDS
jgi:hypothetical protein